MDKSGSDSVRWHTTRIYVDIGKDEKEEEEGRKNDNKRRRKGEEYEEAKYDEDKKIEEELKLDLKTERSSHAKIENGFSLTPSN